MIKLDYKTLGNYQAKPQETILEHTEKLLCNAELIYEFFGDAIDEKEKHMLKLAVENHDIGKANPLFQQRVKGNGKFDPEKEIGHNILSYFMCDLSVIDGENFESKNKINLGEDDKKIILNAIINHHRYVDNFQAANGRGREIIEDVLEIMRSISRDKCDEGNFEKKA